MAVGTEREAPEFVFLLPPFAPCREPDATPPPPLSSSLSAQPLNRKREMGK